MLARIRRLTELGLGLAEVRDVLADEAGKDLTEVLEELDADLARQEASIRDRRTRLRALGMTGLDDADQFLRWFDLMGTQRHLKAIGIFARLNLRDGKPGEVFIQTRHPEAPVIEVVGPLLHVTCPGCPLDDWIPRTSND